MAVTVPNIFMRPTPAEAQDTSDAVRIVYAVALEDSSSGSATVRFADDMDVDESPEDRDAGGELWSPGIEYREDARDDDEWEAEGDEYDPYEWGASDTDHSADDPDDLEEEE